MTTSDATTTPDHTHDAWFLGLHEMPADAPRVATRKREVLVRDLAGDEWKVMSAADFNRDFERL